MGADTIQALVQTLSRDVKAMETDDVQFLANLHGQFEQLSDQLATVSLDRTRHATQAACELLESLILEPPDDAQHAVNTLQELIDALDGVICRDVDEAQITFPEALLPDDLASEPEPAPADIEDTTDTPDVMWTLPSTVDQEVIDEFLARQPGILEEMESVILQADQSDDRAAIDQMKRLLHTLKGESSLLGFTAVAEACHLAEDQLLTASVKELGESLLEMKDWLAVTFDRCAQGETLPACPVSRFRSPDGVKTAEQNRITRQSEVTGSDTEGRILNDPDGLIADFAQEANDHLDNAEDQLLALEAEPTNSEAINSVFRAFHTIKGVAGFLEFNDIQTLAHQAETLLDRIRKNTLELSSGLMDLFFDSSDQLKKLIANVQQCLKTGEPLCEDQQIQGLCDRLIAAIDGKVPTNNDSAGQTRSKLGDALVEKGAATDQQVSASLTTQADERGERRIGEILSNDQGVAAQSVGQALREQRQADAPAATPSSGTARQIKDIVKVDAERLDRMVDTIGELVIAETMVAQVVERLDAENTMDEHRVMNQLGKITRELQEMATSLRMVPVRSVFQRMARLARDVAKKVDKPINFQISGEETELDKAVVDQIADPLIHLVRNAIDHGIESSTEDRVQAGKDEAGQVHLRARYQGGNVQIEIEDDGRGMNRDAILSKAMERGIVTADQTLTDEQIYHLIFEPGFSMAQQVSEISGRGVGMDVVRRNVEAMRGKIEISTRAGQGTRLIIHLPLTMAIMEGMVLRVHHRRYIVPTLNIVRMFCPKQDDLSAAFDRYQCLTHGEDLLPICDLGTWLGVTDKPRDPTESVVVVVERDGALAALVADELIGQQQVVIKTLGATMRHAPGVAGGSIMPDGQVGLILDIEAVFRQHTMPKQEDRAA